MKMQSLPTGTKRRHRGAVVVIGAVGLLLASCGSSDSAADTSPPVESEVPVVDTEQVEVEVADADPVIEIAEPLQRMPRLTNVGECGNGLAATDGLYEYAPVDGEMLRLDMTTEEITAHGPTVGECAFWLGDETFGRKVAIPELGDRVFFGPFNGPWETEVETGGDWGILSRDFSANRLVFLDFLTFTVIVVDATTGERVGEPIIGSFEPGRDSSANAVSGDGSFLAFGGANPGSSEGDGEVFVLDAESGDLLFEVDVPSAVTAMVFDDATDELIVGSFTGELVTIDLASREIVSEVSNSLGTRIETVGIRDDGLVVALGPRLSELIDRAAGPTGASISVWGGRVRPNGTVTVATDDDYWEVYAFEE